MPTFPNLIPNYCSGITMPEYKGKDIEFDDGGVQTVQTQFVAARVPVTLRYDSLATEDVVALLDFWGLVDGTNGRFDVPDDVFRMPPLMLAAFKRLNPNSLWRFVGSFSVEPVTADADNECSRYSTSIQIRGELR
jgi:hypothetical protein